MCEIMQKLQAEGHAAGFAKGKQEGRLEGRLEERTSMALDMLRNNEPLEKIKKYSHLSLERINELSQQIS